MIGPLGRLGAAATLGQHCPQLTQRPGNVPLYAHPVSLQIQFHLTFKSQLIFCILKLCGINKHCIDYIAMKTVVVIIPMHLLMSATDYALCQ